MMSENNNFVGRESELAEFRRLLGEPYGDKRIIFLLGDGGIGKTRLVTRMLALAYAEGIMSVTDPIDLFSTDYRHIDGIQRKIINAIENLPEQKDRPSPFEEYVEGKTDTSEKFYECLMAFCAEYPLVIAFDTFENLDKVASDWLFRGEPDGLQVPGLLCIVAGRDKEIPELERYRQNPLVKAMPVSGFSLEDAEQFYQKIAGEFKDSNSVLDPLDGLLEAAGLSQDKTIPSSIEWVRKVTAGHPLRLEMAFRWSRTLLDERSLIDLTADEFEERLMRRVQELSDRGILDVGNLKVSRPVYETLICMALVTRRFDEAFLRHLIDKKLINLDASGASEQDILNTLQRYFFVKVRLGDEERPIVQLHDHMAWLVRNYVQPYHDQSGEKREALLRVVDQYYDQLIEKEYGGKANILRVEKLYYALQQDWKGDGKRLWFHLADLGNENINKLLPGEIKGYIERYDPETQFMINSKIAEIEREANHFNQSLGYWDGVVQLSKAENRNDWLVNGLVGKFNASWQVDPEKAMKKYLFPARKLVKTSVPEKTARVYYEIGFAYRQMQDLAKAIKWYEKALREFQNRPQDNALEATLRNDAGYAYAQLGKWGDATKYLKRALGIREDRLVKAKKRVEEDTVEDRNVLQQLRSKATIHVGLSHNTLGEFHRYTEDLDEALMNYDKAYQLFVEEKNYYWQSKALCGRGETYRRLALRARVQGDQQGFGEFVAKAQTDMDESLYLCEKHQLNDERDTAYRRSGRLLHDVALNEYERGDKASAHRHLEDAYGQFSRGLDFAEKTKETLEELENLTEMAFLLDDAIKIFAPKKVPDYYREVLPKLEKTLERHADDKPRIHQFPVFKALLKLEQGAVALANGEYTKALNSYLAGYIGLGSSPGYGWARYKQHFSHLTEQIENLPKEEQIRWCNAFITAWRETPSGRRGKLLADELIDPDLVQWCNRFLVDIGAYN